MGIIEDGLYTVFQWIARRRREMEQYLTQYNANMMKSFGVVLRRLALMNNSRGGAYLDPDRNGRELVRRLLFGVRGLCL